MDRELYNFGATIEWAGNSYTNSSSRRGRIPSIVVSHISEGSFNSCRSWFTSPNNYGSSSHFLVGRDGRVIQFVDIRECAWTNGLSKRNIPKAKSALIRSINCSPNWYSVTIEFAGVFSKTRGKLTKAQLKSSILLHRYIIAYVKDEYKYDIIPDRKHIMGHYEISNRKPNCPGKLYPFTKLIEGLQPEQKEQVLKMSDLRKILEIKECKWADPEIDLAIEYGLLTQNHKSDEIVTLGVLMTILNRMYEKFDK